jgi:hypothetical protein
MENQDQSLTILSSLTTQPKMFIFDMFFGFLFLLAGVYLFRNKEFRYPLLVGGTIYLFFAFLWHLPLEWDIY